MPPQGGNGMVSPGKHPPDGERRHHEREGHLISPHGDWLARLLLVEKSRNGSHWGKGGSRGFSF